MPMTNKKSYFEQDVRRHSHCVQSTVRGEQGNSAYTYFQRNELLQKLCTVLLPSGDEENL
jgi:hypothetical protein